MSKSLLHRGAYRAAMEFCRNAPWERISDTEIFAVRVPREQHALAVSVLGKGGGKTGLAVIRGPDAVARMAEKLKGGRASDDDICEGDYLSCTFEIFRDVPKEFRRFYKRAGLRPSKAEIVPFFFAKRPYKVAREINPAEAQTFAYLLRAILSAMGNSTLGPGRTWSDDGALLTLSVDGSPSDTRVRSTYEQYDSALERQQQILPKLAADEISLAGLPRLDRCWLVGFPVVPVAMEGTNEVVRMLAVTDARTTEPVDLFAVQGEGALGEAAQRLFELFLGRLDPGLRGLPAEILFCDRSLHDLAAPMLQAQGVRCQHRADRSDAVRVIIDNIMEGLQGQQQGAGDPVIEDAMVCTCTGGTDLEDLNRPLPSPSSFEEWRQADLRLTRRAMILVQTRMEKNPRLVGRFFGDQEEGHAILASERGSFATVPFADWIWLDHRSGRKGPTVAEEMVEHALPSDERVLLESMLAETVSFYQVRSVTRERSLLLEDLLRGGSVEVMDRSLSLSVADGVGFSARLYRAGNTHFIASVGVLIPGRDIPAAIQFLHEQGLKCTPSGLAFGAQLMGRLWAWMERRQSSREGVISALGKEGTPPGKEPGVDELWGGLLSLHARIPGKEEEAEELREGYLHWLDEPVPALGGKSPRQSVKRSPGRRRVRQMIRCIHEATLPGRGLSASLRNELRAELGLPEES